MLINQKVVTRTETKTKRQLKNKTENMIDHWKYINKSIALKFIFSDYPFLKTTQLLIIEEQWSTQVVVR